MRGRVLDVAGTLEGEVDERQAVDPPPARERGKKATRASATAGGGKLRPYGLVA